MPIDTQTLGWHTELPSEPTLQQNVFVLDASAWSRESVVNQFMRIENSCLAVSATTAVELMTPPNADEFARRSECAAKALEAATIFLPNASRYKRFLTGQETMQSLQTDSRDFLEALRLYCSLPDFRAWESNSFFQQIRTERNNGYLAWAAEAAAASTGARNAVLEIGRSIGVEIDLDDRDDRRMILRVLQGTLHNDALDQYLLPDVLPHHRNAAFHYLRLYRQFILENLPNRRSSAGISADGNDFGDLDLALFVGMHMDFLRGYLGIGIIVESKWHDLARHADEIFPLGSPDWFTTVGNNRFLIVPREN